MEQFKKCNIDIASKLRKEAQLTSKENRYKVVQYFRANKTQSENTSNETNKLDDSCTVFDIELEEKKNEVSEENSERDRYVYDLYYTQSDDLGDAELNEFIRLVYFFIYNVQK